MAGVLFFAAIAAWIISCAWLAEKVGNLIPDREMRLVTKFLLFVLLAATPFFNTAAKTVESGAPGKRNEQNSQQGAVSSRQEFQVR